MSIYFGTTFEDVLGKKYTHGIPEDSDRRNGEAPRPRLTYDVLTHIDKFARDNDFADQLVREAGGSKEKALWNAVKGGRASDVKLLLRTGADPTGEHGWIIRDAIILSSTEIIGILLDAGVSVNGGDVRGLNPLAYAAHYARIDTVHYLISRGADVGNRSVLRNAVEAVSEGLVHPEETLKFRLEKYGVQGDDKMLLWKALNGTSTAGSRVAVQTLLDAGADPHVLRQMYGTPGALLLR